VGQQNFVVCVPKFTNFFFFRRAIDRSCNRRFPFIDVFIHSRDICDQNLKLSKNARIVDIGQVEMSKDNFVVSEPKSTKCFAFNVEHRRI